MRTKVVLVLAALSLAALSLAACASSSQEVTLGGAAGGAADVAADPAAQGTVERPWGTVKTFPKMQKAEPPAAVDGEFTNQMIMHHRQAIELGGNLLAHRGVDKRIAASADFIVQDQNNEITTMKAWLQAWSGTLESDSGHTHDSASMPGMLTASRVAEIATLPRPAAQVAFLLAMIEHHEGAITMSQEYLPEQHNSFTRSTAVHIIKEQQLEIDYMTRLVDELCANGGPPTCPAT